MLITENYILDILPEYYSTFRVEGTGQIFYLKIFFKRWLSVKSRKDIKHILRIVSTESGK